jgi:hypothetical protein
MNNLGFSTGVSGWAVLADGSVEFNNGNFRGDITGASGTFSGVLEASAIDIGGTDAASWHVDVDGNMWWGNAGSYAGATNKISSTGQVTLTTGTFSGSLSAATGTFAGDITAASGTFTGDLSGSTITAGEITGGTIDIGTGFSVDVNGNVWWGNFATYALASIRISAAGVAEFASAIISGTVTADDGFLTGTTGSRVEIDTGVDPGLIRLYGTSGTNYAGLYAVGTDGSFAVTANTTGASSGALGYPQLFLDSSNETIALNTDSPASAPKLQLSTLGITLSAGSTAAGSPVSGDIHMSASDDVFIYADDVLRLRANTEIQFYDDATEVAVIDYVSSVGRLTLNSGGTAEGGEITLKPGSSGTADLVLDAYYSGGSDYLRLHDQSTISAQFLLGTSVYNNSVTGRDVFVTTGSIFGYNTSSLRRKTGVVERTAQDWAKKFDAITAIEFEYDPDQVMGVEPGQKNIGFGAERVAEQFPEVVYFDDDGIPDGIDYKAMVPILWEMVKDLRNRIPA